MSLNFTNYKKETDYLVQYLQKKILKLKEKLQLVTQKIKDKQLILKNLEKKNAQLEKYVEIGNEKFEELQILVKEKDGYLEQKKLQNEILMNNLKKVEDHFIEDLGLSNKKIDYLEKRLKNQDLIEKKLRDQIVKLKKEAQSKEEEILTVKNLLDSKIELISNYDQKIESLTNEIKFLHVKCEKMKDMAEKKVNSWAYDFLCSNIFYSKIATDEITDIQYSSKTGILIAIHFTMNHSYFKEHASIVGYIRFFKYLFNQVLRISYLYKCILLPYYGGYNFILFLDQKVISKEFKVMLNLLKVIKKLIHDIVLLANETNEYLFLQENLKVDIKQNSVIHYGDLLFLKNYDGKDGFSYIGQDISLLKKLLFQAIHNKQSYIFSQAFLKFLGIKGKKK